MAKITYHSHNNKTHTIDVQNGLTVMEGAIQNDIPGIDADCGGGMACATCHVYVKEEWLDKLSEQLNIKPYQKLNVDNYFLNKKVVITGTLNNFTRDEIKTKLNSLGSKFVSQVSKNIDLVIYGENAGSKLSKAQDLNIKMIDEKKLNEILDKL